MNTQALLTLLKALGNILLALLLGVNLLALTTTREADLILIAAIGTAATLFAVWTLYRPRPRTRLDDA